MCGSFVGKVTMLQELPPSLLQYWMEYVELYLHPHYTPYDCMKMCLYYKQKQNFLLPLSAKEEAKTRFLL